MAKKILVVDDEPSIVTLLSFNLKKAGYEVIPAYKGSEVLPVVKERHPDLIILDLMLPEMDGMDICKKLRQEFIMIPIIMLTARDDELDKILGLELGADDYMTKPFSPREVIARVKAIFRRTELGSPEQSEVLVAGELKVYPNKFEATFKEKEMMLTPKEFELLVYMMKHKGRVLTREQLLNAVWNYDFAGDTRIVDVHVSHLRDKIEDVTRKPLYIKTVRGLGYKLEEPKG
ncbi:response regulator transcription factor [Sporolactobacillus sp. Y61]|jgi:two-component system alkaline phosphatase synthesis response regulator PhoP|uniref:Response regulator transcription factor n=1 Tax=Sporolactobacillus sp. Y61 TaxID=3160863 RepID=A0AAU8IEM2_9BACL|nr:response regulator transcription factor [Sporolactobacillus sp. THM19-2]RYL94614.1 response regulator transcription factor [Sporolactobacillus sp. THM19-2]